jgi:ABC-2 type transport system permease protein
VTLLLGAACFCALGLAVAALIPNGEAAPVVANFTFLPVAFISDLFFPTDNAPAWVAVVAGVFPVKHFALALEATFNPFVPGSGFRWGHLAVVAVWGAAAAVVAVRRFRWEPRTSGATRPRRRSAP